MRASLIAALFCTAGYAQERELIHRERQIPVRYVAPSRQTAPKSSERETARKEANLWLVKYTEDKPKGWKVTGFEFKGSYAGPVTDGRSWAMYRMNLNPPLEGPQGPCFDLYFGFDGKEMKLPLENHPRDVPPPRPPAVVELPTKSIGGVRQVP